MRTHALLVFLVAVLLATPLSAGLIADVDAYCPCGEDYSSGTWPGYIWSSGSINCTYEISGSGWEWSNQYWGNTYATAAYGDLSISMELDADYPGNAWMEGGVGFWDQYWIDLPGTGSLLFEFGLEGMDTLSWTEFYISINGAYSDIDEATPAVLQFQSPQFAFRGGYNLDVDLGGNAPFRAFGDTITLRLGRISVLDPAGNPLSGFAFRSESNAAYNVEGAIAGPPPPPEIPEPTTSLLAAGGLAALAIWRRYARTNS